jgi:hypothetical protein
MMKDLRWARQRRPTLNVGVVQDGASELWHRMRAALFDEFAFKRTNRGGQRFLPRGISAVLAVRSPLDSDRLART